MKKWISCIIVMAGRFMGRSQGLKFISDLSTYRLSDNAFGKDRRGPPE